MSLKHMKSLIVLVVGLLAVGCATMKDIGVHLGAGKPNSTKAEPAKELTAEEQKRRDSVVGEYEQSWPDGTTHKLVFLQNGVREWYTNGKEQGNPKWKVKWTIVNGEIHFKLGGGVIRVFEINQDKSITSVAMIRGGKREGIPKRQQTPWKKIK